MTQEEKQLLLKDLCARLPYGVKMKYKDDSGYEVLRQIDTFYTDVDGFHCLLRTTGPFGGFQDLNELKPYLRPMSSMTEEECKELGDLLATIENVGETLPNIPYYIEVARPEQLDWLNANRFDYRGLIPMGLALEAPADMYKTE